MSILFSLSGVDRSKVAEITLKVVALPLTVAVKVELLLLLELLFLQAVMNKIPANTTNSNFFMD